MKRWLVLIALVGVVTGCDRFRAAPALTPTFAPSAVPLSVPSATEAPSPTLLPTAATLEPTEAATVEVATATSTVASTNTPATTPSPTPTRLRPLPPKVTATNTVFALKYGAPKLIGPLAPETRIDGKDDLLFKWQPVADLAANECYQLTVQMVNLTDPVQHYSQDSFLAQDTCNSAVSSGIPQFVLRKHNPPSYQGLVAVATQLGGPSSEYKVRWWVTVVLADGTPLSPSSAPLEFTLLSP